MDTSHDNKPRLTDEEERMLGERISQGDQQALDKLVTANLGFVVSVARQSCVDAGCKKVETRKGSPFCAVCRLGYPQSY